MGPKERKVREKEQRHEGIISAGERLFLKKGLPGTTMEEIARECELSKGTLYLYFSSKEQLYFEIVFRAMDKLYMSLKKAVEDGTTPLEKLSQVGKGYYDFFRDHVEYFRILNRMMDADHSFNKDVREIGKMLLEKNMQVWDLITSIIIDGIKDGTFKPDTDPLEIAISLYASSSMIMQIMYHNQRNEEKHKKTIKDNDPGSRMDEPFGNLDFDKILKNLGWRIVVSIMTHPAEKPM